MMNKDQEHQATKDQTDQAMLKTRTILISSAVDFKLAKLIMSQIILLEQESATKPILVIINSPGGEVHSGFAIFDLLKFVSPPVVTLVAGVAASMGSVLSLAGGAEHRYACRRPRL